MNKGLGTLLYLENADFEWSEVGEASLGSSAIDSASGLRQDLAAVSYAMSAGIRRARSIRYAPASAKRCSRSAIKPWPDSAGLDAPPLARSSLNIALRLSMQDTSDLALALLGAIQAEQEFSHGDTLQGLGNVLNTLGYAALLTGPGIDASELPVGATVLGLDAAGWTGIGAVLVLVGATLYTGAPPIRTRTRSTSTTRNC